SAPAQTIASTTTALNQVRLHHLGFRRGIWFVSFADTTASLRSATSTPHFFRCAETPMRGVQPLGQMRKWLWNVATIRSRQAIRIVATRSEEHTSVLQSLAYLVCR